MPRYGAIRNLTFNLINSLAKLKIRSNALFWITVWITAEVQGSSFKRRGYWSRFCDRFGYLLGGGERIMGPVSQVFDIGSFGKALCFF